MKEELLWRILYGVFPLFMRAIPRDVAMAIRIFIKRGKTPYGNGCRNLDILENKIADKMPDIVVQ